ncbi:FG-GAP repeat domain-containing protein [Streptomyces syringium]|uniref:FG-GAP repeat domain-containing protein n=1 Tax=Streptomyces syringium TaxID=76729 RepID=UPI003D8AE11A
MSLILLENYVAHLPGRFRGRALSRLATAAIAAALVGTTAGTALADSSPAASPAQRAAQHSAENSVQRWAEARSAAKGAPTTDARTAAPGLAAPRALRPSGPTAAAPFFPVSAVNGSGDIYAYWPDGKGGLTPRQRMDGGWQDINTGVRVDHNADGMPDGLYLRGPDSNIYYASAGSDGRRIATDWAQYDQLFTPGNLGGSKQSDILVRDRSGVLWLYVASADGSLSGRKKVGPGWGQFSQIAGRGDLTGDGKADIVARDKDGVLWLYKGTGDSTKPFAARTKIGAGWNQFSKLLGTGDVDLDGRSDLIARDGDGALWLYKGTGNASSPFKARVKIGNSGWNQYRLMF